MKMGFYTGLAASLFMLGLTGMAHATLLVGDTDDLTTTFQPQQDSLVNVNWLVDFYGDHIIDDKSILPYPLTLIGKYEVDDNSLANSYWENGVSGNFNVIFTNVPDRKSGTWSAPTNWSDPLYFSVKAGGPKNGGFALYYAEGGISGSWNPSMLENKDLSHISFWTTSKTPVPEPATILLMGTGLVGLACATRRKKKK